MSTELATQQQHDRTNWTPEQITLLKNTVCRGATDDEFKIFCYAVQRTGLDPFMKQIYAVKRWNSKTNKEDMALQVGIDGFRLTADRTGKYAGSDDAIFDVEPNPQRASVTVYKMVQGQRCPFTATARWAEYYPGDKGGMFWKKMPCVMLAKVAEALALRKAFPAELSGLYSPEEMAQANRIDSKIEREGEVTPASSTIKKSNGIDPGKDSAALNEVPSPIQMELSKISKMRVTLNISVADMKAEVFRLFKTDDPTKLNLEQLRQITALLEFEQKDRLRNPISEDFNDWGNDKPIGLNGDLSG